MKTQECDQMTATDFHNYTEEPGEEDTMEQPPEVPEPLLDHHSSNGTVLHKIMNAQNHNHSMKNGGVHSVGGHHGGSSPAPTKAHARLMELLEGLDAPGDSRNAPEPPPWLDRGLFERGRQFYGRYLFCVFLSDLVALLAMFSVGRILRPLLYTGRSDTPLKALRRYVSTISRVLLWYSGDLWSPEDPAHKNILQVRTIHAKVAATLNAPAHRASVDEATVTPCRDEKDPERPSCPFHAPLRKDLERQIKDSGRDSEAVVSGLEARPEVYLSQWDMAFAQYCFMGVILAHPWRMGAWRVTDEEMEGLVHFWRGCGWLLGIEDKYNFCSGTLEETRALCLEMEQQVVRPCLARAGRDTEHVGTALVDGMSSLLPWFSYPAMLLFLGDTMGLKMPSVRARMTLKHVVQYAFLRFLAHGLFMVPGVVWVFNQVLMLTLSVVLGHHPRWKPKVKVMPYSYT